MTSKHLTTQSKYEALSESVKKGEVILFSEVVSPYNNETGELDVDRKNKNAALYAYLYKTYGTANVSIVLRYDEEELHDSPARIGTYIASVAFDSVHGALSETPIRIEN